MGTEPSAAGDSLDCYAALEIPLQGAAAAGASGGCSDEACLGSSVAVVAHHLLRQLHLAVVAPAPFHLVQAGEEVLQHLHWALHLVLEDHPLNFAAAAVAASASDVEAFAGSLQPLVTWS